MINENITLIKESLLATEQILFYFERFDGNSTSFGRNEAVISLRKNILTS